MRQESDSIKQRDPLVLLGLVCLVATMIFCWRSAATRGLEYDEIFTLLHYAAADSWTKILNELSIPNNHPLHSLLVRGVVAVTGADELWVRMPSLLAGLALWVIIPLLAWRLTRNREVTFLTTVWSMASAPLLHYAQTSRGYELQTLLVVTFALLVHMAARGERRQILCLMGAVVTGMAAVLTLPTSVIFLMPIGICDLVRRFVEWRREKREALGDFMRTEKNALIAYTALAIGGAAWMIYGASQFAVGRQAFGQTISSLPQWLAIAKNIGVELWGWPFLALMVGGVCVTKDRWLRMFLIATLLFPLAIAPLTRGGMARVYVPLIPFGLLAGTMFVAWALAKCEKLLAAHLRNVALLLLAVAPLALTQGALNHWMPTDWKKTFPALKAHLPPDAYVVYSATTGYVLQYYYLTELRTEIARRVPIGATFTLAHLEEGDKLSGMIPQTMQSAEVAIPQHLASATEPVNGVRLRVYRAREISTTEPLPNSDNTLLFAAIGPNSLEATKALLKKLFSVDAPRVWLVLNGMLSDTLVNFPSPPANVAVLLVSEKSTLTHAAMQQLRAESGGKVHFYRLEK